MDARRKRILLGIQSVLLVALAVAVCVSAVGIFSAGVQARATDVNAVTYTPEAVRAAVAGVLPIAVLAAVSTVACLVAGATGLEARPKRPADGGRDKSAQAYGASRVPRGVRYAVWALAVLAITWGVASGGVQAVFNKAVIVCTECIGLG